MSELIAHPMLLKLALLLPCRTGWWCRLTLIIVDQFYSRKRDEKVNRKTVSVLLVKDKWQNLHLYFKIFRSTQASTEFDQVL